MPAPDLFFVDPSGVFRQGLRALVAAEAPEATILGEAANAAEALDALAGLSACVVVLSRTLPDRSGFEVLDSIRERRPELPVVLISVDWEEPSVRAALERGASGVLLKQDVATDLIDAVRRADGDGAFVPDEWSGVLPLDDGDHDGAEGRRP